MKSIYWLERKNESDKRNFEIVFCFYVGIFINELLNIIIYVFYNKDICNKFSLKVLIYINF